MIREPWPADYGCCVCAKRAAYGVAVDFLKNKRGRWYCLEHLPDRECSPATLRLKRERYGEGQQS